MIIVASKSCNMAWRNTLQSLYHSDGATDKVKYFKDEPVLMEIEDPELTFPDPDFPMSLEDLISIEKYICTGKGEANVTHPWTKIYYHRMFDSPYNQVDFLLKKLKEKLPAGDAQISIWDKNLDQKASISPCAQIIWARVRSGKLEMHVHSNSSDAYNKLLMNIREFVSFQIFLAGKLQIKCGKFLYFIDSCHLHMKDSTRIGLLLRKWQKSSRKLPCDRSDNIPTQLVGCQ